MIQHLSHVGKTELLNICNLSWTQGILLEEWRRAEIIPIYKQEKPKHDKTSYRPKVFLAVSAKPWSKWSTGFKHTWSKTALSMTHNQVTEKLETLKIKPHTWLKQLKMLSRKKKKNRNSLDTFFDLSKAFDKVWQEGLLCKLSRCGVPGKMLIWIRDYLTRRCARVKANNAISNLGGGGVFCPQYSFWSTLATYLSYLVLTSTVPYTHIIWQYGLRRKPLVQHKPECRMP